MRRQVATLVFATGHFLVTTAAFMLVVFAVGEIAMGASHGLLFELWQALLLLLGFPVVDACLFLFPAFPWKMGWGYLPLALNSILWAWVFSRVLAARRARVARAA